MSEKSISLELDLHVDGKLRASPLIIGGAGGEY